MAQIGNHFTADLCTKKAYMNQRTNFGACGLISPKLHGLRRCPNQARKTGVWVTTKSAFPALGEPLPLALAHGTPYVGGLALPKFVERGKFSLNKLVIRWISVKIDHQTEVG